MTSTTPPRAPLLPRVLGALLGVALALIAISLLRPGAIESVIAPSSTALRSGDPTSKAYLKADDPSIKTTDIGPRRWKIIDVHEHLRDVEEAERVLPAMDALGVQRMCTLSATTYTYTLNQKYGFEGWVENNAETIRIKQRWPDRFCAFVTIDPLQPDALQQLQSDVAKGADGLKLFLGHGESHGKGPFHVMPLDDPRMDPIYAWAQEVQLPIVYHVNLIKYWDEFLNVMEKYPYLRVNLAHFGLHKNSAVRLTRLAFLLERYPNLYTDLSFGHYSFHSEGFEALAKWRTRSKEYLTKHRNKLLYASDMVLEPTKDEAYIYDTLRSYMQLLESKSFRFFLMPDTPMHGLDLDDETLSTIYERSPATWLLLDAQGALPDRTKGWPVPGTPVPARPEIPPLSSVTVPPGK